MYHLAGESDEDVLKKLMHICRNSYMYMNVRIDIYINLCIPMYKPSGLRSPAVRSDYGCCPYRRERWELNNVGGRVLGPFRVGIRCTYVCTTSLFAQTVFQYESKLY